MYERTCAYIILSNFLQRSVVIVLRLSYSSNEWSACIDISLTGKIHTSGKGCDLASSCESTEEMFYNVARSFCEWAEKHSDEPRTSAT